jgi:AraC family transcriptional regulator
MRTCFEGSLAYSQASTQKEERPPIMTVKLMPGDYFGIKHRARQSDGLTLSEYECAPGAIIPEHSHHQTFMSFVLNGGWQEWYGAGKSRVRRPHTLAIHAAGEVHSEQIGEEGSRAFHVEFSEDWLGNLGDHAAALGGSLHFESGPLIWLALRLYAEFRRPEAHSGLVIEGIVLESIGELSRKTSTMPRQQAPAWLLRVDEILRLRFRKQLSLPAIAKEVRVHPVHLARTFRRYFNCSIGERLRDLRVQCACRELAASDRPLAEIAISAGFCDQSHLSRAIRRRTGLTPSVLRENGRPPRPLRERA